MMLHKQQRKCSTSLLELEAAEYFKLDLSQMNLSPYNRGYNSNMTNRLPGAQRDSRRVEQPRGVQKAASSNRTGRALSSQARTGSSRSIVRHSRCDRAPDKKCSKSSDRDKVRTRIIPCRNVPSKAPNPPCHGLNSPLVVVGSSTTSTNSLPSITSSPSVSPSLVCPHLSLEDILDCGQTSSRSPHTIGLCPKCRLDPPPNIHSPLSPQFRPDSRSLSGSKSPKRVTRGFSDHQASYCSMKQARMQQQQSATELNTRNETGTMKATGRHQSDLGRLRDDSLDFSLELSELRRMQMSPTLRNSVEFIRRNSIESARIVRIFKNGQPFENPLRICILRGEFVSLTHLLDHINSRLLIPLGARYLFHLDGQLVYSVHELKHGSIYVVSGSRAFDYRTSEVLKEQQRREQVAKVQQEQRAQSKLRRRPEQSSSKSSSREDLRPRDDQKQTKTEKTRPKQTAPKVPFTFRPIEPRNTANSSCIDKSCPKPTARVATGGDGLPAIEPKQIEKVPARVIRAKSELSALPPKKQKKNVTFMDTGRGSSPVISELSTSRGDEQTAKEARRTVSTASLAEPGDKDQTSRLNQELATSEIGIQVSNSIDGFLIDLPVALPAKGDDSNLASKQRPRLGQKPKSEGKNGQQVAARGASRPAQIVTITERQLSNEEMTELTDLSEGDHHDHHDHHEVIIEWNPVEESKPSDEIATEPEIAPDRSNTISIGSNPQDESELAKSMVESGKLVTSAIEKSSKEIETDGSHWQYPGGDAASSTPTERPVSQSGPNESVRARVTTPTPSLSTGGDNNSLTLSYDTITIASTSDAPQDIQQRLKRMPSLADKQRKEVVGALCDGLDVPTRNFRLVWVNGFTINDLYPENSVDVQRLTETGAGSRSASNEPPSPAATNSRLSPAFSASQPKRANEFKPSERYHNFICHSRKHDELVFPAGAIVVLWCRWTNEQRYYAQHNSNVTCLALATLDLDLAASAQIGDSSNRRQTGSLIHLWSLSSLALLRVLEDDQFKLKSIFSMRLKNSKSKGCELSVAARDEKQLFLFEFTGRLDEEESERKNPASSNDKRRNSKGSVQETKRASEGGVMMRASRLLQSNQSPLFVVRVPKLTSFNQDGDVGGTKRQQQLAEPLISFGRRHFSMWTPDVRQRKLRPMQPDEKSAKFSELLAKANCMCRISPDEFLLGDSDGNVTLLMIGCGSNQTPTGSSAKRKPQQKPKAVPDQVETRYSVRTSVLLRANSMKHSGDIDKGHSISCLTRISGSLFMSADSSCTIRFWKMRRPGGENEVQSSSSPPSAISCEQLRSICLPPDLGFICTLLLAQYNLKESVVEFYVVSTSNSILFGSVKLPQQVGAGRSKQAEGVQQDLLSTCSLSVVYEGHETHVSGLVADSGPNTKTGGPVGERLYFTCSLDCRICKWNGKQLLWKSMLPSACVSLAVHPLGNVLAVGSVDGTVYILDKTSGLLISYFPLTPVRINCLAYSSDGSLLAAGCVSGSIFMLPVDELGLKYKKVSIFQSPNTVVSLQFSLDNRYMLTSVSHSSFQELILWDLPNFRYMRDDVKLAADKITWFDPICSGSEDVRAIWENAHLSEQMEGGRKLDQVKRFAPLGLSRMKPADQFVVNLSCHRLMRSEPGESFVVASDTRGHLRLFQYPAYDIQQGFFAARICSSAVNCCRFLESARNRSDHFVSTSLDGSICLWTLE